jgi:general stress protein CsbA
MPRHLDAAFPTLVRYIGLVLTVALIVALIVAAFLGRTDVALILTPGFVATSAMILYKTLHDASKPPEAS